MRDTPAQAALRIGGTLSCHLPLFLPLALAAGLAFGWDNTPAQGLSGWLRLIWIWAATSVLVDPILRRRLRRQPGQNALVYRATAGILCLGAGWALFTWPEPGIPAPTYIAVFLLGAVFRRIFTGALWISRSLRSEALRWILVGVTAGFAIHPYATKGLVGLGDALFYTQQLNDIMSQAEAGRFPAFVGKSAYSNIGDIHPLRTAPYFQYAGLALDLATGRRLGAAGVQNLMIVGSLVLTAALTYLLGLKLGGRRAAWPACLLAVAVGCSPGILSLIYSGDMVASWMTLPYLPVLFYALFRAANAGEPATALGHSAAAYAVIWLAHAPIALSILPLVALILLGIVWQHRAGARGLWLVAGTGLLTFLLSAYCFVSVASLELPGGADRAGVERDIVANLAAGAAGLFRPIDPGGTDLLGNLQLSPVLWFAAAAGLAGLRLRLPGVTAAWSYVALLLALVWPTRLAANLWSWLPDFVLSALDRWPMQRFFPILTCLVPFLMIIGLRRPPFQHRTVRFAVVFLLALGCGFSLVDSLKLIRRGYSVRSNLAVTEQRLRPENAQHFSYSYGYYGLPPSTFFLGPKINPGFSRLLAKDTLEVAVSNRQSILAKATASPTREQSLTMVATGYVAQFSPKAVIEAGKLYLAVLDFGARPPEGMLELSGRVLARQYILASWMEPQAMHDREGQPSSFYLWTTDHTADEVEIRFHRYPNQPGMDPEARLRLIEVDEPALPVRTLSLIPYRVAIEAPAAGWLETPKLFTPGYAASVDGIPIAHARSPDGLIMIPVSAGTHHVELRFAGSKSLHLGFWLTLTTWVMLAVRSLAGTLFPLPRWAGSLALTALGRLTVALGVAVGTLALGSQLLSTPKSLPVIEGRVNLTTRVVLPQNRWGQTEALARFRSGQDETMLQITYLDPRTAMISLQRGGLAATNSRPLKVNYRLPQDLVVTWGAPQGDGACEMRVQVNHQTVITATVPPGTAPGHPQPDPEDFSGKVLLSSR